MSESSTVTFERTTPRLATLTFSNPPANITVGETLARLSSIVGDLENEPEVQVVVFRNDVPDFFLTIKVVS